MKPQDGIWIDDVQGFMAAQHDLKGEKLDLIIHSTGGSGEAAEQIDNYLRQKYSHIRVIVPLYAMSAATMIACAADEIVMGKQSALGPIDPQFQMGERSIPAHAIVKEFELAIEQIKQDRQAAAFWVPKLSVLPHGHYAHALAAIDRASSLVQDWLERYAKLAPEKAAHVAEWLAILASSARGDQRGLDPGLQNLRSSVIRERKQMRKPKAPKAKIVSFKVIHKPEEVYVCNFDPIRDEADGTIKAYMVKKRRIEPKETK